MKKFPIHTLVIFIAIVIFRTDSASAQIAPTNIEVTASPKQSSVSRIGVTLSGVELEDAFQRQSKSRGLNPSVFREELVSALKELHPGTIRMEFPDLGQQLAAKFSVSGATVSGKPASGSEYGLGEFLQLCAETGSDPWLRIPSGTTPEQMREVVEYLSDSGSDDWSAARIAAGQSEPWTQVFGKIHVELGNESSGVTTPERMEAGVYAGRANADFGAARQTAGFNSSKFDLMLSGAGVSAEWSSAVLGQAREQDSVAIAADLSLRGAGASEAELYGALLAEPEAMDSAGGMVPREVAGLAGFSSVREMSVNVGRSQLSLTTGESEKLAQSWGAGLAQAEHLLQMMAVGVRYENGAVLTENSLHCVGGSEATNCRSSQFLSEALANGVIGGTMLQTVQTGANPSWSQVLSAEAVRAHALQSFAFVEGGKVSLVLFNLSRTEELPATFSGTNAPAGDVQMAQIAPREITDGNENGAELQPSTQMLSNSDLSSGLSLPPYSMTVLSWEAGSGVQTAAPVVSGTAKVVSATSKLSAARTLTAQAAATTSTSSSTPVFNCSSGFASSGSCGVGGLISGSGPFEAVGTQNGYNPSLSGSSVILAPAGADHTALSLNYQTQVNVQAFTTSFTFVPNGQNVALVFNNSNNNPTFNGAAFSAGAGCEAGFFQAFSQPSPPNNVFALELDSYSPLILNGSFAGSSVQTYVSGTSPCLPNDSGNNYPTTSKISTSPVNLTTGAQNTTTGHVYSATVTYDGSNLTLNLYDVTAGGSCPGASCFTKTWTSVNIPAAVGSDTAWVGFTEGTGTVVPPAPLYVSSFAYTPGASTPTAATPTFSLAPGTYSTAQTVSISDATSGATIYYTTNGTTPTTSSSVYSAPITVSATETLEAIAVASGYSNSAVASATFTISLPTVATPVFSVAAGTYATAQTVSISDATNGAAIYYTTNGTTPTTSSTKYSGSITVSSTETLEAIAVASGYNNSAVATASYTINAVVPAPTFSPAGGTYTTTQTVTISDSTAGTAIYYTTNGTTPTTASALYTGPITVSSTETLEAIAVATGDANSVGTATYTIMPVLPAPTLSLPAGTYSSAQSVTISDATAGTTIYYTTNGTTPTTSSTKYIGAIAVSSTETLEAIAVASGYSNSSAALATYTINPVLPAPTFSLAAGTYTTSQSVTISDATAGTTIYYTTNATTPTTSSTKYSGVITVSATETLEAIAVETGYTNSAVASVAYIITPITAGGTGTTYINYPSGGFTATGLSLDYGATVTGNLLQLTDGRGNESRSAWFATPVPVQSFTTDFTFQQLNASADGMTFAIQPNSHAGQGDTGGGLGYQGIPKSVAVKFDLYNNAGEGPDSTGLYTDGASPTVPAVNLSSTPINLHSGDVMHAHLVYDGTNLTMTLTDTVTSGSVTEVFPVNIPSIVGGDTAYVGFTGGTGGETATQNVLSWSFVDTAATVTSATKTTAAPTFSPAGGSYTASQMVTISNATAGATVYYTTNGTTPTTSSAKYTGALTVSASETIEAIAVATGYSNSPVASATYTMNSTAVAVTAPAFSPAAGTYTTAPSVKITSANSSATIYYTTNGATPTTSSTKYTGAISMSASGKLRAIAVVAGQSTSPVTSAIYYIEPVLPTPTFSVAAGTYTSQQFVAISDTAAGVTIYYTTNGGRPTTGSTKYTGPITVSATETVVAFVAKSGYTNSAIAAAVYSIKPILPTPTFSSAAGTYTSNQSITISESTAGAAIYYTTNGSTPTTSSTKYTGAIAVGATEKLEAIAVAAGHTNSPVASADYTIATVLPAPIFSKAAGTYAASQSVTISDAIESATIYYTTNGTTPTTSSTHYTGAITVSESEKLEAMAVASGHSDSAAASAAYTIVTMIPAPTFSKAAGTYSGSQSMIISDAVEGTTIYYTVNGATPTTGSPKYIGAITVNESGKVQAIAVATGHANSPVASAVYTINKPTPAFSVVPSSMSPADN